MDNIIIYNTMGRKKQDFSPLKKNKVSIYHCGPTVYWTQHIGNLRGMTMADLVVRVFKYNGYKTKFVRNYTDVGHLTSDEDLGEDKMSKASQRENLDPNSIAEKYIKIFEHDMAELNNLEADVKPRATDEIPGIIKMIKILLAQEFAYQTELAIYFDISKAKDYNKLSGQKMDDNLDYAGSGEVRDQNKKNPRDFALWFFKTGAHKNALQTWSSPWGEGFPGWHIECSEMSQKYLGKTIDIHMGGIEHIPVHHTNEIAQSEAAFGKTFVNYWLHNEHLTVKGGKMAKSEGVSYALSEIKNKGFNPLALRYLFLQAHYRSKQNFTWEALASAQSALNKLYLSVLGIKQIGKLNKNYNQKFIQAANEDFNIPQALAVAWEMLKSDLKPKDKLATLLQFDLILGLNIATNLKKIQNELEHIPAKISQMITDRTNYRLNKNFEQADLLREKIEKAGFWLEDTPTGTKIIPKL